MRSRYKHVLLTWLFVTSGLFVVQCVNALPLELSVSTDKSAYIAGERLIVDVTAYNPNDQDVYLSFPSALQAWYEMDDVYDSRGGYIQVFTYRDIPAHGSYTWSFSHRWSEYDLTLGTHSVVGNVLGVGSSDPFTFDVVTPVLPTTDFTIDFTNLPDGRTLSPGNSIQNAYAAWGVHFGTYKNSSVYSIGVDYDEGNQFAVVYSTSYPPGFNILAQFDMPVYDVAAEVSGAEGITVTMVAKDAAGQVIASVTSDTVPAVRELVGPIELHATTPIATLEWWPSYDRSTVIVDNLFVGVTPPLLGDLDGDGFVCLEDLNIVLNNWNLAVPLCDTRADASSVTLGVSDGYVGLDDLDMVLKHWGEGTPPTPAMVPEPAALVLMGLGCAVLSLQARH